MIRTLKCIIFFPSIYTYLGCCFTNLFSSPRMKNPAIVGVLCTDAQGHNLGCKYHSVLFIHWLLGHDDSVTVFTCIFSIHFMLIFVYKGRCSQKKINTKVLDVVQFSLFKKKKKLFLLLLRKIDNFSTRTKTFTFVLCLLIYL